jgi:hypothetical protein
MSEAPIFKGRPGDPGWAKYIEEWDEWFKEVNQKLLDEMIEKQERRQERHHIIIILVFIAAMGLLIGFML